MLAVKYLKWKAMAMQRRDNIDNYEAVLEYEQSSWFLDLLEKNKYFSDVYKAYPDPIRYGTPTRRLLFYTEMFRENFICEDTFNFFKHNVF